MSVTPKIHLTAFDDRAGQFIFVAVPDERGRYLRTDRSVALVNCPLCGAMTGEPCFSGSLQRKRYGGTTHHRRRLLAKLEHGRNPDADDILCRTEIPDNVPDEWMEAAS